LSNSESCGILVVYILEEMETIARAIRPITYKKTFRNLKAIFVYAAFILTCYTSFFMAAKTAL
jgi:hypothetical protein